MDHWFRTGRRPRDLAEFVHWYWKRLSSREGRGAARLIFELYALALRHPDEYPGVLEHPVAYWKALVIKAGVDPESGDETATLLLAVIRGLLLDLAATGNAVRIERALRLVINRCLGDDPIRGARS